MLSADPSRRYGDYVLLETLGKGGMSEVDLARRSVDRAGFVRFLVIKRILKRNTANPTFVRMFMDEARINAELQHENIAQVYDFGERNGEWYLAMEYVPGIDLRSLQKAVARQKEGGALLPPRISLRILYDVLSALQYAHHRVDTYGQPMKIVHRDVNPRNIMVSIRGEVKLIDFGVAKADTRHDQTTGQTIKGKFAYMAPEQIESPVPVDGRADLFAVGLVLQELLTGSHPFRSLTEIQIIHRLVSGRVDPMPECLLHPDPAAVREVRDRSMATRPDDRYRDAHEFQEALVRLAAPVGGLASRAEVAGFFRRAAPEAARKIADRLESWRDARPTDTFSVEVPPGDDSNPSEDTWASDLRTMELPKDAPPGSFDEVGTVADGFGAAAVHSADSVAAEELEDPPSAPTTADFDERSASSMVRPASSESGNLPIVAAIAIGGSLGLAGLAILAVVLVFLSQSPEEPQVLAPNPDPPAAVERPKQDTTNTARPEATPEATPDPVPASPRTESPSSPPRTAPASTPRAERSEPAAPPPETAPPPKAETVPKTPPPKQDSSAGAAASTSPWSPKAASGAAPEPEEPVAFGFLFLSSRPNGMEVVLDGKSIGTTPIRNQKVPVGTHTVTVRDPETGTSKQQSFQISENQPKSIQVQL